MDIVAVSEGSGWQGTCKDVLFWVMPSLKVLRKQKEEIEFILKAFFVFLTFPHHLPLLNLDHLRFDGRVTIHHLILTLK